MGQDVDAYWDLTDYNAFAVQLRYDALGDDEDPIEREVAIAVVQGLFGSVEALVANAKPCC